MDSACNDDTVTYEEISLDAIIPEDNICYISNTNPVKSVRQSQREHLNTARGSDGERKFLFMCFLISVNSVMIIISATFMCTVYTLIHLELVVGL